jgi:TetR/AcrR family fatty acid metabolism transcriptional regulator
MVQTRGRNPQRGFVYLLRGGDYYKIGRSEDVDKRIIQLASQLPFELELVHVIETDDVFLVEKLLLERFASKRTRGEWFALDDGDVAWIKARVEDADGLEGDSAGDDPDPVQPLSRRVRLKQEREERILDAAAAVFARKGFHEATIRDVAELANVADGTIYNYFDSKFALLIGIMSRVAELGRLPGEFAEALEGDVRDFFVTAFRDRMRRIEQGEELLRAILPQVFINPGLRERFHQAYVLRIATLLEGYVQAQVERGQIRPVDVPLATRMLQAMFVGILILRILGDDTVRGQWDSVPELLATIFFDGLGQEAGG